MPRSKYKTHVEPHIELIKSWRESGLTLDQISEKLKIANSTIRKYADMHEALAAALHASKEKLVANLKKSLWQEAMGYEYTEVQESAEILTDKDGKPNDKPKKLRRTKITKFCRGVPNLLIFALCNLCPEEFKRIDKEVMKEIETKIDEKFDNERIKTAFDVLYDKAVNDKKNRKKDILDD